MNRNDRTALSQALALCRNEGPFRSGQIDSKLKDEPWEDVAAFAASCCQSQALDLFPWQMPPCNVDEDDDSADADAVKLLRKMLRAGVSRFDPDPLTALAKRKGTA